MNSVDRLNELASLMERGQLTQPRKVGREIRRHVKALEEALINARSIVRAFTGDLTKYPKSEADAGHIDASAWTVQQELEAALGPTRAIREGSNASSYAQ